MQEAVLDLGVEQVLSPALTAVNNAFVQTMIEHDIPIEAIVVELVLSGEVERTYRLLREIGYAAQSEFHSPTSQYGQLSRRGRFDHLDIVATMRGLADDIESGRFADEWDAERDAGYPTLDATQGTARRTGHPGVRSRVAPTTRARRRGRQLNRGDQFGLLDQGRPVQHAWRDEPDGPNKRAWRKEASCLSRPKRRTAPRFGSRCGARLHVEIDAPPPVFDDEVGLQLADPEEGWRERGDMHPIGTSTFRASIVARARFVEDLVTEQSGHGLAQYVILGAGLDTFAQRRPEIASRLRVFEVDQPGTQAWKRRRLIELGFDIPDWLRLVPVDFGADESWWERLVDAGFDPGRPTLVASAGVTMYLTRDANAATLRQVAALAPGSTFVTTFLLPAALLDDEERAGLELAERGARASGTPFISFFAPEEMLALARRRRLSRRPPRVGRRSQRALLRRKDRRPAHVARRRAACRDDLDRTEHERAQPVGEVVGVGGPIVDQRAEDQQRGRDVDAQVEIGVVVAEHARDGTTEVIAHLGEQ